MAFEQILQSTPISIIPSGTAVGAPSTGRTFAAPVPACLVTWQILYGTAPASVTIELQASNDGVNFTAIDNTTTLASGSVRITASSARFLRAVMTAVTGGDTWQVIVSASPMGVGRDNYANNEVKIGGQVLQVGLTGTTTAKETLFSMGINARSFVVTQQSIKLVAYGTTGANAAVKSIFIEVSDGIATDTQTVLSGAVNNVPWTAEYLISRRSFGSFIRRGLGLSNAISPGVQVAAASLDETLPWTLKVTASTGTATINNVVLHNVIVTTIPGIPNII